MVQEVSDVRKVSSVEIFSVIPLLTEHSVIIKPVFLLIGASRIKVLFRETVSEGSIDAVVEAGAGKDAGTKSGRAAQALAKISKGDDKLTRKSEEQVSKVKNIMKCKFQDIYNFLK